jgi:capsular polysaccharide transport system permease protein
MTGRTLNSGEFSRGLRVQMRVVGALIMREIITRYGRHNIGFMWLFVEPMMFTIGVLTLYTLFNHSVVKVPLVPFTVIGYSTVLLWRNTMNRCGNAIEPNRALLHHRYVRVIDLYIARIILEASGASIAFLTLVSFMVAADIMSPPDDIFKMIVAWLLLAWFAMSMGMLIGCLAVLSETVERVWHVLTYLFLPVSGAFVMIDWLPKHFQSWAMLVPPWNSVELLRDGYYGAHVHAHFDVFYVVVVNAVVTLIALLLVRRVAGLAEGE